MVDELIPSQMKLAEVQQILQMLLREQVPIRQLSVDPGNAGRLRRADQGPGPAGRICAASARAPICTRYRDAKPKLYVVTLDPALEDRIRAGFEHNERGLFIRMSPQAVEITCELLATAN